MLDAPRALRVFPRELALRFPLVKACIERALRSFPMFITCNRKRPRVVGSFLANRARASITLDRSPRALLVLFSLGVIRRMHEAVVFISRVYTKLFFHVALTLIR